MDSKPQRPLRAFRGVGDENAFKPELQKHKSTGALSAISGIGIGGGLRVAAKRTAFAELNTVKNVPVVQDDSAIYVKGYDVKKVHVAANTLARPPMRATANPQNQHQPLPALKQSQSMKVMAPIPGKRATVYHDAQNIIEYGQGYADVPSRDFPALVNRNMIDQSAILPPYVNGNYGTQGMNGRSEQARQAEQNVLDNYLSTIASIKQEAAAAMGPGRFEDQSSGRLTPEEMWEEPEDDDQDYTTAMSFRSGGNNTTGAVTVYLYPQFTSDVRAELDAAARMVLSTRNQEDVDDEAWDTSMVAEYSDEIFQYMREVELELMPDANYMRVQNEIQWSMRAVLMDWMIQVHSRFQLLPETLFLCINLIDRFLEVKVVSLGKLQLVGIVAIYIAAKYEEVQPPTMAEILYMVDNGYSAEEILKAERYMLGMLEFRLGSPGPLSFLRRISKADDYDLATRTLAKYFIELTIMDERFVGLPPSFIAAGGHCLARMVLKKGPWTVEHVHYSGYTWKQVKPLACLLLSCCENAQQHHSAIYEKYCDKRYKKVAMQVQDQLTLGIEIPGHHGRFITYPAGPSPYAPGSSAMVPTNNTRGQNGQYYPRN